MLGAQQPPKNLNIKDRRINQHSLNTQAIKNQKIARIHLQYVLFGSEQREKGFKYLHTSENFKFRQRRLNNINIAYTNTRIYTSIVERVFATDKKVSLSYLIKQLGNNTSTISTYICKRHWTPILSLILKQIMNKFLTGYCEVVWATSRRNIKIVA